MSEEPTRVRRIIEYGVLGEGHCGAVIASAFKEMPDDEKLNPDMARAYIAGMLFRIAEALAMSGLTADEIHVYAEQAIAIGVDRANEFTAALEKERGNLH